MSVAAVPAGSAAQPGTLIDTRLVQAHCVAALASVLLSVVFGILISLQFFVPDYAGSWLTGAWGRMRFAHTQGIMLGWLGNAFLAFLYHAVPILTGRQVTSPTLGVRPLELPGRDPGLDTRAGRSQPDH
jgi:cbb3-type cytochrome oxidase subunit 1